MSISQSNNYLCTKHLKQQKIMKKIIFILMAVLALTACDKKKDVPKLLDQNATITIKPAKNTRALIEGKTAMEIVQECASMKLKSMWFDNKLSESPVIGSYTFHERQKDYTIPALKMLASDVILYGELSMDFIEAYDVFLVESGKGDTIAYIPNEVLLEAKTKIVKAYNDEDYEEVYRLFDEAYVFYPMPEK